MTGACRGRRSTCLTEWTWKRYRRYREGWEDDHCAFCTAKLAEEGTPNSLHEGYSTADDYHWVCKACFADFREQFNWTVVNR